jgi:hypothetical protein
MPKPLVLAPAHLARRGPSLLRSRHLPVAALITAAALISGVSTAAAAEQIKPTTREAAKLPAPDADVSAAAARIDAEGSALGSYWDPDRAELVVAVGPDSNIGEAEAEKLVGGPFRLERLEIAKKTADAIREEIAGREFGPDAQKYSYTSHVDLQTGRVALQTDAPASVTERLVKEHPEIELRDGKPVEDLFNRRDDIPSFWGGASIQSGGGVCSTGFTVRNSSGARFITTAAHCYAVGATVRTPTNTLVGTVTRRGTLGSTWFFDNRDAELIGGQSYAARVYTGGVFSTSSKALVSAGDPVAGVTGYCSSGQTSGEQCNQTVQSTGAMACTSTGCKWPVIEYTGGPSQGGDSGGSFYIPSAAGQVFARGAVIAGNGTTSFAEPWSRISSSMGVSIAT